MFSASHTKKPKLTERFDEALVYVSELHRRQLRKGDGGIPYVSHLMGVASIALEYGADEDEAIAALLHDAVEDQGGDATRQDIRRRFGDRVTEIVDGCTDADTEPKPPWEKRKREYIAHVKGASESVLLVSASDKLHNARTLVADFRQVGDQLWDRFSASKEQTLWYYQELARAFKKAENKSPRLAPLFEEVERTVNTLVRLSLNLPE